MANEDSGYKDISELKKDLEGMKDKKDISTKELYDAVHKLAQTMADILEIFGAAAEQMKLEEKGIDSENKKHEMVITKLDKLLEQNKAIAEGMVAVVEMFKQKMPEPKERENIDMPKPEPRPIFRPQRQAWHPRAPEPLPASGQQDWQPRPEPMQRAPAMQQQPMPLPQMPPMPDFGTQLPPMQPEPFPDLNLSDELDFPEDESKKKGLFGMFKKQ